MESGVHFEFCTEIKKAEAAIKQAITSRLLEAPAGTLFIRVILFTGKLCSTPPISDLIFEALCIGIGGKKISFSRIIIYKKPSHWCAVLLEQPEHTK